MIGIGKEKCKYLREIRKRIAKENNIRLVTEECTYKGECTGTCPRCEAEVRYLESELDKRQKKGKIVTLAGLSLAGIAGSSLLASCDPPMSKTSVGVKADKESEESFFITEDGDTIWEPIYEGEIGEIDEIDETEDSLLAPEECKKM